MRNTLARAVAKMRRLLSQNHLNLSAEKETTSQDYWSAHNVTAHRTYSTTAESLNHFHWRNAQYPGYIDLMPVAGHDGEVVLDYGCGPGHDLVGFGTFSKPSKLIGIDVSEVSLEEARQRLDVHKMECEVIQVQEPDELIPLADNSVDYIHCSGVLNHVASPDRTLAEFHRILKPHSDVRIMVYNSDSIWVHLYAAYVLLLRDDRYRGMSLQEAFRRSTDGFDCPISRRWQASEMVELGRVAGFEATHLGNAISLFELSLMTRRFEAMMDPAFGRQSRELLTNLRFNEYDLPIIDGQVAGIDGCYKLTKLGTEEPAHVATQGSEA
jgi:ubiquinone/menaquinone biosynthesis C-methylase UbiE